MARRKAAQREVALRTMLAALEAEVEKLRAENLGLIQDAARARRSKEAWLGTSNKLHSRLDEIHALAGKEI